MAFYRFELLRSEAAGSENEKLAEVIFQGQYNIYAFT